MNRNFDSINAMKEFAKRLAKELYECGLSELSGEVIEFQANYFTTSSEYLGEFRILLNIVLSNAKEKLSAESIESIIEGISAINKAFKK